MKRILKLFILLLVMFITPNVMAKDKVSIESVTLDDKSDTVTEVSKPSVKDLNISFDLSFSNLNDYAKYKVVINNTTNTDYEISKDNNFNKSDYLEYKYEFDNTNVVKANSKLTMYVVITYKNEVPSNKLVDGKYVENNNMAISLSNGEEVSNPKTGLGISLIIGLILVIGITLIVVNNNKSKNYLSLLVVGLMMIPLCGYALEKLQINVNTKVTIDEKYEVTYSYWNYLTEEEAKTYKSALTRSEYDGNPNSYYIIDGKKYTEYYVTKSDGYYSSGQTVNVKDQRVNEMDCNDDWVRDDQGDWTCNSSYIVGKTNVLELDGYCWKYSNKNYNDLNVLNFRGQGYLTNSSYEYEGNEYRTVSIRVPKSFTMPSHEVNFIFSLEK